MMVQGLMSSHGRVQSSCCAVVITLSWHRISVDRLQDDVLVCCALCAHREGGPADVLHGADGEVCRMHMTDAEVH